jgi:hypothetical protein
MNSGSKAFVEQNNPENVIFWRSSVPLAAQQVSFLRSPVHSPLATASKCCCLPEPILAAAPKVVSCYAANQTGRLTSKKTRKNAERKKQS